VLCRVCFALLRGNDLDRSGPGCAAEFIEWAGENGFRLAVMSPINEIVAATIPPLQCH